MKTKTRLAIIVGLLLVLCFFVLGAQTAAAQTSLRNQVSGGIVFSDGQNAVYYDLKTNRATTVAIGSAYSPIKHVAIDPLGRTIVYTFGTNQLAITTGGNPVVLPKLEQPGAKSGDPKRDKLFLRDEPYLSQKDVKNLAISPTVPYRLAFEYPRIGRKWIPCNADSEIYNRGVTEKTREIDELTAKYYPQHTDQNIPRYIMEFVERTTIDFFLLQRTIVERTTIDFFLLQRTMQGDFMNGYCGEDQGEPSLNSFMYRDPSADNKEVLRLGLNANKFFDGKKSCSREEYLQYTLWAYQESGIKLGSVAELLQYKEEKIRRGIRSAHYPAFSPTIISSQFPVMAYVYHTLNDDKWGPIVISQIGLPKEQGINREISIYLNSCHGLAWRPDNTISYESEGKIYSEDGKVLVEGIDATRFFWVSQTLFLYRDSKGTLWIQDIAKCQKEKLLESLPEEFSYGNPYFAIAPVLATSQAGTDRQAYSPEHNKFFIGALQVPGWYAKDIEGAAITLNPGPIRSTEEVVAKTHKGIYLMTISGSTDRQFDLEWAWPQEAMIEDIKDPSQYRFSSGTPLPAGDIHLPLNKVLLLRRNNLYAAIEITGFNIGRQVPRGRGFSRGEDTFFSYRWKYWGPSVPKR